MNSIGPAFTGTPPRVSTQNLRCAWTSFTSRCRWPIEIPAALGGAVCAKPTEASSNKPSVSRIIASPLILPAAANFEHGQERFLRDFHSTNSLHPPLALFLLFEKLAFTRDVAAVALGEHVLPDGGDVLSRDHLVADGGLQRNLEHLARNQLAEPGDQGAATFLRELLVHDHRQCIHRLARDQNIELGHLGRPVAGEMIIERSIAARRGFQAIVEIEHDFVERQHVGEQHAPGADVLELFLLAACLFEQLEDLSQRFLASDDGGLDERLFDLLNLGGVGPLSRVVHIDDAAAAKCHAVTHAGRGGDEIDLKLAFETFLHDLEMEQAEKTTAETEA